MKPLAEKVHPGDIQNAWDHPEATKWAPIMTMPDLRANWPIGGILGEDKSLEKALKLSLRALKLSLRASPIKHKKRV